MSAASETQVAEIPLFRKLSPEDRFRVAAASAVRRFEKGEALFREGDPSDALVLVLSGRVKVFKTTAAGKDVILEVFGPGDSVGAVAVFEDRPFPASAEALEEATCLFLRKEVLFRLLEDRPAFARALLSALSRRLVVLTSRLSEQGGRVESRLARLFLKLAGDLGQPRSDGVFVPLVLSRQELADFTCTTVETCIRVMSRWGKEGVVRTDADGFLVIDREALEELGME